MKPIAELNTDERILLNRVAREQMKKKLLADIRIDLMICELEGWDKMQYLNELRELINGLGRK